LTDNVVQPRPLCRKFHRDLGGDVALTMIARCWYGCHPAGLAGPAYQSV